QRDSSPDRLSRAKVTEASAKARMSKGGFWLPSAQIRGRFSSLVFGMVTRWGSRGAWGNRGHGAVKIRRMSGGTAAEAWLRVAARETIPGTKGKGRPEAAFPLPSRKGQQE